MKQIAQLIEQTVNGHKNVYLILTLLFTLVAAWYNLKSTMEVMALNVAVTSCETAEIRLYLQKQEPFTNECYKLVTDEVQRKIRGLP